MSVETSPTQRERVVIVGAGFGGLAVARELAGEPLDVTIVDRHNFHTFQPLLYQVATAGLNSADVALPVRGLFQGQRNVGFRHGAVTAVDWDRRAVTLDNGAELGFEYLVIATGAATNTFGIPGAAEYGFPLYTLDDAVRLRNHVLEQFEAADANPSKLAAGLLTFVVVGGGPTGVEVAGALTELFDHVLAKDYDRLDVGRSRVVLVEMAPSLLASFRPASQRHALESLRGRSVEVRLDTAVTEVTPAAVTLAGGETIACRTLVWAAGIQANPLAATLGVPTGAAGRVTVGPDLAIPGRPGAYAIGDIADIADARHGPLPQLAPVALQSGRHVARQIVRGRSGAAPRAFRYRDKGTMATIGRRAAVAELPGGISLRGTPAWFAWLGLHIVFLLGFRNRLSVLLSWAWNYLTYDRGPRMIFKSDRESGPPR